MNIARNNDFNQVPELVGMNPTSLPELSKQLRDKIPAVRRENLGPKNSKIQQNTFFQCPRLEPGLQTSGWSPGEEILRRIRIWGERNWILSSRREILRSLNFRKLLFTSLHTPLYPFCLGTLKNLQKKKKSEEPEDLRNHSVLEKILPKSVARWRSTTHEKVYQRVSVLIRGGYFKEFPWNFKEFPGNL